MQKTVLFTINLSNKCCQINRYGGNLEWLFFFDVFFEIGK